MLTYLVIYSLVSGPCILFLNKYLPSGFTVFMKPTHRNEQTLFAISFYIYYILSAKKYSPLL